MKEKASSKTYMVWPLCLVALVPLLMKKYTYDTHLGDYPWFHQSQLTEYFLHIKMVAMIVALVAMLVMIFIHLWVGGSFRKPTKMELIQWIPLTGYLLLAIISTVLSENRYFGIHGISEQFESIWVIIGYVMTVFYAYQFVDTKKKQNIVLGFVTFTAGVIGTIGALQSFGVNLIPVYDNTDKISVATLYNSNYMGVFCAMLIPVMISMLADAKKWWKLLYTYVLLVLVMSLVGSQSKTGIVVTVVMLLCSIPFYRKQIKEHLKIFVPVAVIVVVAVVGLIAMRGEAFTTRLLSVFKIEKNEVPAIDSIKTKKDGIQFGYGNKVMKVSFNENAESIENILSIRDAQGNEMERERVENYIIVREEEFAMRFEVAILDEKYLGVTCVGDHKEMDFIIDEEAGTYKYYLGDGAMDKMDSTKIEKSEIFEGYERMFSGRGYIWGRTFPMLKKYVLLGSGADTFMLEYPNNDYLGKHNFSVMKDVITKPHNLYLQESVQSGVVSIVLLLIALISTGVVIMRNAWSSQRMIVTGLGVSIIVYLLMAMLNDSLVVVTPMFWLVLGLGIAQKRMEDE